MVIYNNYTNINIICILLLKLLALYVIIKKNKVGEDMKHKRKHKFYCRKSNTILLIIIFIVCTIFVFLFDYLSKDSGIELIKNYMVNKAIYDAVKDVLIVLLSILGTNLILSFIIEVKKNNKLYDDFIANDLLCEGKFLKSLEKNQRDKIHKEIEKIDFFENNKIYSNMYDNIKNKIINTNYDCYYENYTADVTCNIKKDEGYIEKNEIISFDIYSIDKQKILSNYMLRRVTTALISNKEAFEWLEIKINGNSIDVKNDVNQRCENVKDGYDRISRYEKIITYTLNKKLSLRQNKPVKIELYSISRTPLNDKVYSYRLKKPTNKFKFRFTIVDLETHKLHLSAYGFQDDARDTPFRSLKNGVVCELKDWIFVNDGVVVSFD